MADKELAIAENFVRGLEVDKKAHFIAQLEAFCLDVRALVASGLFLNRDPVAGSAFYDFMRAMNKQKPQTNPWKHARESAELVNAVGGSAARVYEIVEALEEFIKDVKE